VFVIGVHTFGGPNALEVIERPDPHAAAGEVRIRVRAATVNPVDTLIRSGGAAAAFARRSPPIIPGLEAAGEIDEIGPGTITDLQPGQAVMAMVNPTRAAGGAYAQYLVLPASWVVAIPAGAGLTQAATLPMNGLTARRALDQLGLPAASWVAVSGAAGAVGGYAVQLAKADGLLVLADANPCDHDLVAALGADVVVRRGPEFSDQIRSLRPGGVEGLIDAGAIGLAAVGAVRDDGHLAVIRGGDDAASVLSTARERGISVHQTFVHDYDGDGPALGRLARQVESGVLTLRVARTMPAAAAPEAHRLLEQGGIRGRIVLTF
jgi:NADPH:quinone reductase-like Zn-dependent oxidoreductase